MKSLTNFRSKKGVYGVAMIGTFALMIGIAAIIMSISAQIQDSIQDEFTINSYAYNVTSEGLDATDTFSDWLPTISLILAAAIVIGILVTSFRTGE